MYFYGGDVQVKFFILWKVCVVELLWGYRVMQPEFYFAIEKFSFNPINSVLFYLP